MSWVTVDDIAVRLGTPLEDDEALRAQAVIEDVEALVIAYCKGTTFGSPPPDDVRAVVNSEVQRIMNANPGILAENIGEIHTQYSAFRFGLSADARSVLKNYRTYRYASVSLKGGGLAI